MEGGGGLGIGTVIKEEEKEEEEEEEEEWLGPCRHPPYHPTNLPPPPSLHLFRPPALPTSLILLRLRLGVHHQEEEEEEEEEEDRR